jgi:predicted ATP-grasp superfamily ATP-dependent carboligase
VSGEAAPGKPRVVLVTDGEQRAALAAVRSLGAAGFSVVVASSRAPSIAGVSRHTRHFHLVPSPLSHPQDFVGGIEGIVRTRGVDVLLPMADASLIAVLGAPDRFPGVSIPFVSLEQFQRISNKAALLETARELGIAVPKQWVIPSAASADEFDASCVRFPVILKPARSVVDAADCRVKLGVSHASTAEQLSTRLREYPVEAFPILLQQRIVGPGIGIFLLVWDGQTVAVFGHRRLREAPPSGGVSVYRESVVPSDALVARSRALLDKFSWHGVAMVEYKVDSATGTPYLMEVNGRFWGSLQLAIDAGIDFPTLLVKKALGDGLMPSPVPRVGVRSRWEFGEVNHLLARLRKSAEELSLPPGSVGLARTVLNFLSWHRGDRLEVFRFSDPAPFFREAIEWIKRR